MLYVEGSGMFNDLALLFSPPVQHQFHQVFHVDRFSVQLVLRDCPQRFGEPLLDAGGAGTKRAYRLEEER